VKTLLTSLLAIRFLKTKLGELNNANIKTLPEGVLHSLLYLIRTDSFGGLKNLASLIKPLQKLGLSSSFSPLLIFGDGDNISGASLK
jgi:hypothetical protein